MAWKRSSVRSRPGPLSLSILATIEHKPLPSKRLASMHPSVTRRNAPSSTIRLALLIAIAWLLSGWTCNGMFVSCQGLDLQPQITSLSPDRIPGNVDSVELTVEGSGFTALTQIVGNGTALPTTMIDQQHLQTTITQQTLASLGVGPGGRVQISARSRGKNIPECPIKWNLQRCGPGDLLGRATSGCKRPRRTHRRPLWRRT